jgi:predicted DNA-binding transcriptional regulator AlpA
MSFVNRSDIVPTIPIEEQSPHRGAQRAAAAKPAVPDNPRLWDRETTCAFFGGIDVSTLYRGMREKRYPRPVMVSANKARWLSDECAAALDAMIVQRSAPKPPSRRGRKRGASATKAKTTAEIEPTV